MIPFLILLGIFILGVILYNVGFVGFLITSFIIIAILTLLGLDT